MHVTIERKFGKVGTGMTGLFKVNAFSIELGITFTETELAAITQANLKDYTLIERPFHKGYGINDPEQFERLAINTLRVGALLHIHKQQKPNAVYYSDTQPEADRAEQQLREALRNLKSAIERGTQPTNSKDSFEL